MAASDSAPRTSSADGTDESAAGMAHLTVVPANFDPDDSSAIDE
ncbi:hydrolase [Natrinema mahii]|nr:hydrolase [Natrinema mahii]